MAVHDSRERLRRGALAPYIAVMGLAVALFAVGILTLRASDSERLVDLLLQERFTAGRLAGGTAWAACTESDSAGFVPRTECAESRNLDDLERLSDRLAAGDSSPGTLRGLALLHLRVAHDVPERLQKAAESLQMAAYAAPRDAALLNDLAVTYLLIAEREQRLDPMIRALENVDQAYALDPADRSILFNRALIRQRLFLIHEADQAWTAYLGVERNRRWRREAERHLEAVRSIPDTISWDSLLTRNAPPRLDALLRGVIEYRAKHSPQIAREFAFPLLAAWGKAIIADNTVHAERWLAIAREIGDALTADSSVALAVDAIDSAAGDADRLDSLALGHISLANAFYLTETGDYKLAEKASESAEQWLRAGRSPARRWAAFYDASSEVNLTRYNTAQRRLDSLLPATPSSEPALQGKTIWARGVIRLRIGDYGIAIKEYREAEAPIDESGEEENRGTVGTLLSEALFKSGQIVAADSIAFRALRELAPYRQSKYLANQLNILAESVRARGLTYASLALVTEAIAVGENRERAGLGMPSNMAIFFSARALDHATLGNREAADRDLDSMERWAGQVKDTTGRALIHPQLARGQVLRLRDPAAAFHLLAEVVERYRRKSRTDLYLPSALYEAALAAQAAGRLDRARYYLTAGLEHVEAQRDSLEESKERAKFYETVENLFDLRIALEIAEGRRDTAFAALERGRVSIWADDRDSAAPPSLDRIRATLPDRTMLVEYALLPDRLVIWTVTRDTVRHHVVLVSRREIAELTARFEHYTSTDELRNRASASARLFNLLILPITPQLPAVDQLAIVPDRELYGVPFAALWHADNARFLIESHALRTVPSAAFYLDVAQDTVRGVDSVLVVGNPELHPDLPAELLPLGGAAGEADSVAARYPGAHLVKDSAARRETVVERLAAANVFHFAGHAVFDPERPEESYLALAPDGSESKGTLRAREIGNLSLSNLQVVVLSACSTMGQRATRTGPAAGLAYSFLAAGAPATVSTLWDVPDSSPTRLLVGFHRHLAGGAAPAEALRRAQREAIARGDTPRAWAAFVYTGP